MEIQNYNIDGVRGKDFKCFIQSLLKLSNLQDDVIETITNSENIKIYEQVFTHKTYSDDNYEFFELLGDSTCNKIIIWYLKERFPFLNRAEDVKVLSRLKIVLVSGKNFSKIAEKYDFEKYISFDNETRIKQNKSVMEDCFEAFFGATEYMIDKFYNNFGYIVCYSIFKKMLDEIEISLAYNDLYDSITRLKETFDYYNSTNNSGTCPYIWGQIKFEAKKNVEDGLQYVKLLQKGPGREEILMTGCGNYLDEVKQKLSQDYIDFLSKRGYKKPIAIYYQEIEKKNNEMFSFKRNTKPKKTKKHQMSVK